MRPLQKYLQAGEVSSTVSRVMRGRPRAFDTERVLDDAMKLFWRRGYRATTTRDLEATLGLTQSSLYNAFGSKANLLKEVLARYREQLERELLGPLRDGEGGIQAVDTFFGGLADWLVADGTRGCLIGRMMSEGAPPEPLITRSLAAYLLDLRGALEAALARAARAGEIPADSLGARASLLVGTVLGMNLAIQAGFGSREVEAIADGARAEITRWLSRGP